MHSFFSAEPEHPEADEPTQPDTPPWWGPPDDELPAIVPATEVLATTPHLRIALAGAFVHREGVELRIERRLRRGELPAADWHRLVAAFMEHGPMPGPEDPAARLRFGLVLGDGTRVLDDQLFRPRSDPMERPAGHTLMRTGGGAGGGDRSFSGSETLWLWPLPPEGPLELVMQWPALGVDETRAVLDGTAIRRRADDAVALWSEE